MPKDERALPSPPSSPVPCPTSPFPSLPGPYPGFFLGGPIEHRRRENRGAEGCGVRGGGHVPLPAEKFLYFKYENGAFLMEL
jgi:hypothetical protein